MVRKSVGAHPASTPTAVARRGPLMWLAEKHGSPTRRRMRRIRILRIVSSEWADGTGRLSLSIISHRDMIATHETWTRAPLDARRGRLLDARSAALLHPPLPAHA